jgi:excinuclease UvrABC ATPase subunit
VEGRKGEHVEVFESARRLGFTRGAGGTARSWRSRTRRSWQAEKHSIAAVVDRLVVADKIRGRLTDSVSWR